MQTKLNFVLIHGAWHGGWVWGGVSQQLRDAGHLVTTPTLPGHGPGDDRKVSFEDYVRAVGAAVILVAHRTQDRVILVGHSSAGLLLQTVAPLVEKHLHHLVYLNAFILPEGLCQFDLVPPEAAEGMTQAAQASGDLCVPVMRDFVCGVLMAGDTPEDQTFVLEKLVPQPLALFTTKMTTSAFGGPTPKTVIFCKDDVSLPPGAFLGMATVLGDHQLIEIEGGHEALFTQPDRVAAALLQALSAG